MKDFFNAMQAVGLPVFVIDENTVFPDQLTRTKLDPTRITSFTTPKAKQNYTCEACGETIIQGCKHDRIGYDEAGTMRTIRAHLNCFEVQAIKQRSGAN